jgi:hypothetical protein
MQSVEDGVGSGNDDGASHPFNTCLCTNCGCPLHRRILYGKFIINELNTFLFCQAVCFARIDNIRLPISEDGEYKKNDRFLILIL